MKKKYEIETIEQLVDAITPDNFANFMIDFTDMMIKVNQIKQQIKKTSGKYPKSIMKQFTWINDKTRGVRCIDINGEKLEFNQFNK